jgi:hypothetical protein
VPYQILINLYLRDCAGVGIASDVAEQRLVIHIAALLNIEARRLRKPHRQHARS